MKIKNLFQLVKLIIINLFLFYLTRSFVNSTYYWYWSKHEFSSFNYPSSSSWFNHWKSHKAKKRKEMKKNLIYFSLSINRPCPYAYRLKIRIKKRAHGKRHFTNKHTDYILPDRLHHQLKIRTYTCTCMCLSTQFICRTRIHSYTLPVIDHCRCCKSIFEYFWQLLLPSFVVYMYTEYHI